MAALTSRPKHLALSPFLLREFRGRWRKPFGPLTLFLYTALLAYLTWQVVQAFGLTGDGGEISLQAAPGRRFLGSILPWLTALWLLVAPIVTCGSISMEREQGMLAPLMLSGLSPREVIWGKWLSALAFQLMLLLVPTPIWLVGLGMGGVEPWEVLGAIAILAAIAAAGSALGMTCSAWANTSFQAFGGAFATLIIYGMFNLPFVGLDTAPYMAWALPLSASVAIFSPHSSIIQTIIVLAGMAGITWMLLDSAAQGVRDMPLEPRDRMESAPPTTTSLNLSAFTSAPPGPHPSAHPLNISVLVEPASGSARATVGHRSRWERYPIRNAVARREVRRRTRYEEAAYVPFIPQRAMSWREQRLIMQLMLGLALLLGFWIQNPMALVPGGLAAYMVRDMRFLFGLSNLLLVPACLAAAYFGASTFSREREQGTLQEITNLPLRSWEITGGFLESALWLVLASLPQILGLVPIALLFVPCYLVAAWLLFAASLITAGVCVGLCFSWIGHHTNLAVAGALAAIVGYGYLWLPGLPRELLSESPAAHWFLGSPFYPWLQAFLHQPGDLGILARYGSLAALHFLLAALLFGLGTLGLELTRRERQNPLARLRG